MTTEIAIALLTVLGTAISAFVGGDSVGKDDKLPAEKNWRIKWTSTIISLNAWRSVRKNRAIGEKVMANFPVQWLSLSHTDYKCRSAGSHADFKPQKKKEVVCTHIKATFA